MALVDFVAAVAFPATARGLRMTGRQKIEAALSQTGTPEIPAVICYEGISNRDHWDQLTSCPWWYIHDPDIDHQMEWRRDYITKTGQDWFYLPLFYSREERENLSIEVGPDGVFLADRRTAERNRLEKPTVGGWPPSGEVASYRPARPADSPEEIDAAVPLPPDSEITSLTSDGRADLAWRMLEEFGERLYPIQHAIGPLWGCYDLWGFEGMMTMVASRPDLVEYACRRILARQVQVVRRVAAAGAAGIWIEECMTDMVSPAAFARLNVPFLRELVQEIRTGGMKSIYYYCGNPWDRWDLFLDVGADALAFEEGKKGFRIDIEEVVERVSGRCTVLGNLDAVAFLGAASEKELRREIARQIAAGRRNASRFIMSIGSPVTPATPVERVRLYCDIVHELGLSK